MDDNYTGEVDPQGAKTLDQNEAIPSVAEWVKKFHASEKNTKHNFLWKYKKAKTRIRAENEVNSRNSYKMTHFNVPLAYSIGSNFVNSVYFKAPECSLTAREEVDFQKIENTEVACNDWLKDKQVKKTVRRCIWDAYSGGFGARFIDHNFDSMDAPPVPVIDPMTGQPQVDELGQPVMQPAQQQIVLENKIVMQRIRPDMLRIPKGFDFDNYQESPWIGFDVIMPIEEAKSHKEWTPEVMERLQGVSYEKLSDKESNKKGDGEDNQKYCKISYCFEKPASALEDMQLYVFCDEIKDAPLQYGPWDKGTVGYPIKFIYFNPLDDDNSFPNGDCWNMESQFSAIDTWWKKYVRHVERSNPKRIYDSSAIDDKEAGNLKGNNDLEYVAVKNKDRRDIRTFIMDNNAPELPPAVDKLYATAQQILNTVGPKSGMTQGNPDDPSAAKTATQAKIIASGDMIDIEARIDDVKDFISDIVLDLAGIMEKSLLAGIPVKKTIASPGGPQEMIQDVNKDGFTGKINVDVDVESMQAQNKDVFRKQLIDSLGLFNTLKPFFDQMGMMPNPKFWIERLMETMHIRNIEEGFMPMPPPMMAPPPGGVVPPQGGQPPVPQGNPSTITGAAVPDASVMGGAQQL